MTDNGPRPPWYTRRNIAPFTIDDAQVNTILNEATHAVVSWVTQASEPVSAVMLYRMIDGVITLTSTTNRAKYHAWRRNPAACFCTWEPGNIGRQVTLRGKVEIRQDPQLLEQFTHSFLTMRNNGEAPSAERLAEEVEKFNAPDRHMIQFHAEKVLTHDLNQLFAAEMSGEDVWG